VGCPGMMGNIKQYIWVAHLFAIAICSYFAAQTVTTYLGMMLASSGQEGAELGTKAATASVSPLGEQLDYEPIVARNMFSSVDLEAVPELPPEEDKPAAKLTGPAVKTSLNIKILGTLVVGNGEDERSSAVVVGGKSRKADVFYVQGKETFEEGVELVRVKRDRIEFVNKGKLEYAMLEGMSEEISIFATASEVHGEGEGEAKKKPIRGVKPEGEEEAEEEVETSGDAIVIDQAEIDEALSNLDRLYTEIRIVPNFKDGKPAGMKVLAIKPGSLFSKLGLQRGDILEKINGQVLDIKSGMQLFGQLKNQKKLKVEVVRRGESQTMEYEIR
jgi:general secretion pathway protein C